MFQGIRINMGENKNGNGLVHLTSLCRAPLKLEQNPQVFSPKLITLYLRDLVSALVMIFQVNF